MISKPVRRAIPWHAIEKGQLYWYRPITHWKPAISHRSLETLHDNELFCQASARESRRMNWFLEPFYRVLLRLFQRSSRHFDARLIELEILIDQKDHEITQLRSQLDQYQSIFPFFSSLDRQQHHRRSGVSAPPSTVSVLTSWRKPLP